MIFDERNHCKWGLRLGLPCTDNVAEVHLIRVYYLTTAKMACQRFFLQCYWITMLCSCYYFLFRFAAQTDCRVTDSKQTLPCRKPFSTNWLLYLQLFGWLSFEGILVCTGITMPKTFSSRIFVWFIWFYWLLALGRRFGKLTSALLCLFCRCR